LTQLLMQINCIAISTSPNVFAVCPCRWLLFLQQTMGQHLMQQLSTDRTARHYYIFL